VRPAAHWVHHTEDAAVAFDAVGEQIAADRVVLGCGDLIAFAARQERDRPEPQLLQQVIACGLSELEILVEPVIGEMRLESVDAFEPHRVGA
jgi:hypothetical protein